MLKSLIKFLIFIAVICVIAYIGANALLDTLSYRAINYIIENLQIPNLRLSEPSFDNAEISSYNAVRYRNAGITADMELNVVAKMTLKARVNAGTVTIEATNPFRALFIINMKDLSASIKNLTKETPPDLQDAPEALQKGTLTVPLRVNFTSPSVAISQIRMFAIEMKKFSEEGKTAIPIEFSAEEIIKLQGKPYPLRLWVEQKGDVYRLLANKNDLKLISDNILPRKQSSSPADIEIIANNPVRALRLLRIRSRASTTASDVHAEDPRVPEKAYRHVLWSYLVAKAYGADFAKEVTDAHELTTDAEEKNNPRAEASHREDYNNNEVGRKYAALGYSESSILNHVMTDPAVIREIR